MYFIECFLAGVHPSSLSESAEAHDGGYHGVAGSQERDTVCKTTGDEKQQPAESRGAFEVRDDLLHSAHKFLQVIDQTLQQLEGIIVHFQSQKKCIHTYT